MKSCPTKLVEEEEYDPWTGETGKMLERVPACQFVDISLHSYRCTTCGEVGWYSERGRVAEQLGINVMDVTAQMVKDHPK